MKLVVITRGFGGYMEERFEAFTVLIANINRCIYKIKTEEMSEFNLKSSHVSCLYYLYKQDSLTARELCDICGEDKANVSRSIKYLETNGYLVCKTKSQKRYLSPLKLTEKGVEVARHITEKIDKVLGSTSDGLSDEERSVMYKSLAKVNENLNKICSSYGGENN